MWASNRMVLFGSFEGSDRQIIILVYFALKSASQLTTEY